MIGEIEYGAGIAVAGSDGHFNKDTRSAVARSAHRSLCYLTDTNAYKYPISSAIAS